ncbi:MAG: pilus assembly protein TadG-related protein, partial [Anaerolineales bacterium]
MKRLLNSHTRGQSMVLMVFLTIAIFGVLAFSLDMGYTYYNRRWAQNAADSGALAAARELCIEPDLATGITNATNAAIDYVESKNLAFGVNSQTVTGITFGPDGGLEEGEVQVDVAINHPNFVANFFGRDSTTVPATAAAGCFAPGAAYGIIPLAWKCHNIIEEEDEDDVCDMTFIGDDDECEYPEDYMYI